MIKDGNTVGATVVLAQYAGSITESYFLFIPDLWGLLILPSYD
jgi:hypothetical protein